MNVQTIAALLDDAQNWAVFSRSVPKLVVFDCDDILVENENATLEAVLAYAHAQGWTDLNASEAKNRFVGYSLAQITDVIAEKTGHEALQDAPAKLRDDIAALLGRRAVPVVGAFKLLQALRQAQVPFRVVSNSSCKEMLAKCLKSGLSSVIEGGRIHSAPDMDRPRVDPHVYAAAAEKEGLFPSEVVTVEESVAGMRAAQNADMRCILIGCHLTPEMLAEVDWPSLSGRVAIVETMPGLREMLAKLFNDPALLKDAPIEALKVDATKLENAPTAPETKPEIREGG